MSAWHLTVIAVIAAGCTVAALQLDSFLFTTYWQCHARRWRRELWFYPTIGAAVVAHTPFVNLLALTPQPSAAQSRLDTGGIYI